MEFSMVDATVKLMDIKPLKNAPSLGLINELARQLAQRRGECRKAWWDAQSTVCLDNKRVMRVASGTVRLGAVPNQGGTVIAKSGNYQTETVRVKVLWRDGSISEETVKE